MRTNLLTAFSVLLLASLAFAAPVDDQPSAVTEIRAEESRLDKLFQMISREMRKTKKKKATTSTLHDIPADVWIKDILPKLSPADSGNLRLANNHAYSMVKLGMRGLFSMIKICGESTARSLFKQQLSNDYTYNIWATKNWVETLDKPHTIRLGLSIYDDDKASDLLAAKKLFQITKKCALGLMSMSGNRKLQMPGIRLGKDDKDALVTMLNDTTSLQTLYLVDNEIGLEDVFALADAVKTSTSLKKLVWGYDRIGDTGAEAFADMLKMNTSLEELSLAANEIGNTGAEALADGLKFNRSLKKLHLNNNNIDDIGARFLADAWRTNTALKDVSLLGNKITKWVSNNLHQIRVSKNAI